MSGIDYLISQGIADNEKLGSMGWSYGGYMTAWAITQTDRFRAAAVGAGPTNAYSIYGQTDIPEYYEAYFGAKPWEATEAYQRHSPMFFVGNIKTPTLILHGEKDERVPLSQSRELYQALKTNNIPVEYAIYPPPGTCDSGTEITDGPAASPAALIHALAQVRASFHSLNQATQDRDT
ncbi:MAG: S9 family peptidase [Nitrospinae bacterium]|nr:S9 family peptidase [Nitrospinota bacterium]